MPSGYEPPMSELGEAALHYAQLGFAVLPLIPRTKEPLTKHGVYDASKDLEVVRNWWRKYPNANIGLAAGPINELVVIDIDFDKEKGLDGFETLREWEKEHGEFPETWRSITGRKGCHLLYRTKETFVNNVEIAEGIDIKSAGGLIAVAPSIHPNGNVYAWEYGPDDEIPLAEINDSVRELLRQKKTETISQTLTLPEKIKDGSRNDTLFRLASSLQAKNLSNEAILAALVEENKMKCDPPLPESELRSIVNGVIGRYEKGTRQDNSEETEHTDSFLSFFKPLARFDEIEPEWLVQDIIPKGQIVLIASDGGAGKTTMTCELVAAISSGNRCFLDPDECEREPALTAFLSTEDSVSQKLRKKLREAGANMENVLCPDFSADKNGELRDFKFGTRKMADFIEAYHPALVVFDPLQGFTPVTVNMGARNQMRDCLAPFIGLGEKYGTSFLILCHSNKRKGAYGRDRIADSADLWDIARSVLMIGYTDQPGQRYLSHEKSNYGNLQESILFSINDDGKIMVEGRTWKRDREFQEAGAGMVSTPKREDCKAWIIGTLEKNNGKLRTRELDDLAKQDGYTVKILRSSKDELKAEGRIYYKNEGFKDKAWFIILNRVYDLLPSESF